MNNLLWIAGLLVIIWIIANVTGFLVGAILNLLWIVALIMVAVWVVRKVF